MAVLKRMINNVRVENNFTPMSAILAERLLIYVAKGNFLGLHFQNHAFAQRDNFGNEINFQASTELKHSNYESETNQIGRNFCNLMLNSFILLVYGTLGKGQRKCYRRSQAGC